MRKHLPSIIVAILALCVLVWMTVRPESPAQELQFGDANDTLMWEDANEWFLKQPYSILLEPRAPNTGDITIHAANDILWLNTKDVNEGLSRIYEELAGEKPTKQVEFRVKEN